AAKSLAKVMVSTDGEKIAQTARLYGCEVPFIRPKELAHDNTPSIDVVLHALDFLEQSGEFFDAVCLLQPTSPFRPKGFIEECIQKFLDTEADC
ncbi:hypothetical protein ACWKSR_11210, partial [Campylobacter fetus subsp. venerealis]